MSQLSDLLRVIIGTILPIFLVVGLTMLLGRWRPLDIQTLSRISIYLFSPALILVNISQSKLDGRELSLIAVAAIVVCVLLALGGSLIARGLRYERALASTFILTAFVMNSVNFGFPFIEFAFGKAGLEPAVAFSVGQALTAYLIGTFVASRGSGSWKTAVTNVLTIPMPYAFALGLWLNTSGHALPLPVLRASEVLAQGAVTVMLIVLGLQLSRARLAGRLRPIFTATLMRFGMGAVFAVGVALLFGLQGMTRQVFILEASMPAGILTGVLSTEFGGDPEFAAATILVTTLASALFLSGLFLVLT